MAPSSASPPSRASDAAAPQEHACSPVPGRRTRHHPRRHACSPVSGGVGRGITLAGTRAAPSQGVGPVPPPKESLQPCPGASDAAATPPPPSPSDHRPRPASRGCSGLALGRDAPRARVQPPSARRRPGASDPAPSPYCLPPRHAYNGDPSPTGPGWHSITRSVNNVPEVDLAQLSIRLLGGFDIACGGASVTDLGHGQGTALSLIWPSSPGRPPTP